MTSYELIGRFTYGCLCALICQFRTGSQYIFYGLNVEQKENVTKRISPSRKGICTVQHGTSIESILLTSSRSFNVWNELLFLLFSFYFHIFLLFFLTFKECFSLFSLGRFSYYLLNSLVYYFQDSFINYWISEQIK
jgi:hypothetical protein